MDADSQSERWITVQEFRTYFHLKKSCSPVISGYFQRIYQNPTYLCPYRVIKTEQIRDPSNPYRSVRRYLVKKLLRVREKMYRKVSESLFLKHPMRTLNHGDISY